MSKMNLQKLRQICHLNEGNHPVMEITLPPNDPLNRVEFADKQGNNHSAQARAIRCNTANSNPILVVAYSTDEDFTNFGHREIIDFNIKLARAFYPRLKQIFVEHGFHSRYLPYNDVDDTWNYQPFVTSYIAVPQDIINQITHACYTDGREMRRAVEYQAELNKK